MVGVNLVVVTPYSHRCAVRDAAIRMVIANDCVHNSDSKVTRGTYPMYKTSFLCVRCALRGSLDLLLLMGRVVFCPFQISPDRYKACMCIILPLCRA